MNFHYKKKVFKRRPFFIPHKLTQYNGDITNRSHIDSIQSITKKEGHVMIGRGALRNPGIFEEIRGGINHPTATKINRLIDLSDLLIESCTQANPDQGYALSRLKGHWEYFCEDLEEGKQLQRKLKKAKSIQQFIQEINSF